MHAASFGLSVVLGNWVVDAARSAAGGESTHVAGVAGGLVLFLGVVSRPLGGRLMDRPGVVRASFLARRPRRSVLLTFATPLPLAIAAAALVGLAAGVPFASAFAGAQRLRPDAPAPRSVLVNMVAAVSILVGTPLLGLSSRCPAMGGSASRRRRSLRAAGLVRQAPSSSASSAFWTWRRFSASSQIAERSP